MLEKQPHFLWKALLSSRERSNFIK